MKYSFLMASAFALLIFSGCKSTEMSSDDSAMAADSADEMSEASPGDIIVQEHLAALGGMDALSNITSVKSTAEVSMPAMDMTLFMTSHQKSGKLFIEVDVPQMGAKVLNGFDGETAWESNPMAGGPTKLGQDRANAFKEQADIDGYLVGAEEAGFIVTYLGDEEIDGLPNHKFNLMRPDSTELSLFLDAETKLPSLVEVSGPNPMTGIMGTIRTYMSDYRDVGGVPMQYRMAVEIDGEIFQTISFKDIRVNVPMNDSIFTFPGE